MGLNPIEILINRGWNTVKIKIVSERKEEKYHENIILNGDFGQFDFEEIDIQTRSLEKVSEEEDTIVLKGSSVPIAGYVTSDGKTPVMDNTVVEVTITKVS